MEIKDTTPTVRNIEYNDLELKAILNKYMNNKINNAIMNKPPINPISSHIIANIKSV